MPTIKSAIKETKDQLFLDTADGEYLTALSGNFGLIRPKLGFHNDSIWRAVTRELALDYKQVISVFYDLLFNIFGPKFSVSTALKFDVPINEEEVYVDNWMAIPQRGMLILDKGLLSEETLEYILRDPNNGLVTFNTPTAKSHTALVDSALSYLMSPVTSGLLKILNVEDGTIFPDPGTVGQYPVLIDSGLPTEEVTLCTSKSGNNLTVSSLAYNHTGPTSLFATTDIVSISPDERLIFVTDIEGFNSNGVLFVQQSGGSPSEFVPYSSVNSSNKAFDLRRPLTNTYVLPTSVTETAKGSSVQVAQVLVQGIDWDVFLTEEHTVKIYLPPSVTHNRLVDVSFLHDRVLAPPSSTLSAGVLVGGTALPLVNATNFPDSGIVNIDVAGTSELISYSRINRFQSSLQSTDNVCALKNIGDSITLSGGSMILVKAGANFTTDLIGLNVVISGSFNILNDGVFPITAVTPPNTLTYTNPGITENPFNGSWFITGLPAGATKLFVDIVKPIQTAFDIYRITTIDIGYGTVNSELVNILSIDAVNNSISISATTNVHSINEYIVAGNPNTLYLDRPLTLPHSLGNTVDLWRVYLPATTIESGKIFTSDNSRFQGKYLWSFLERSAESTKTALTENISGPTYVVVSQQAGRTALEVHDASLFNSIDFSTIRIGDNLASREEVQVNDITLRTDIVGRKIYISAAAGTTKLYVYAGPNFPEANGYRVFIGNTLPGPGTREEVAIIKSYIPDPGIPPVSGILVLESPLLYNHSVNETVQLMSDVLTIDTLANDQDGIIPYSQRTGLIPMIGNEWASYGSVKLLNNKPAIVRELRSYINVISAADSKFEVNGGYLKINFGKNRIDVDSQLASDFSAGVSSITVMDGSKMPSSNFWVIIGEGTREYEFRRVVSRLGNSLNLANSTSVIHKKYEWVLYFTGDEEEIYYNRKVTGGTERFVFDPPIALASYHQIGEPVAVSRFITVPSKYGTDFPFYLPSFWKDRLKFIFDIARAAGVQVIVISDR